MKKLIAVLLLCALLFSLSSCSNTGMYEEGFQAGFDAGYKAAMEAIQTVSTEPPPTTEPPSKSVPEPNNGYIFEFLDMEGVAPFSVETAGTGGYYIVLDPLELTIPSSASDDLRERYDLWAEAQEELDNYIIFYVRAGYDVEIDVPLGEYEVYYATGDQWCGEDELFGSYTAYYKCDELFEFTETDDSYLGWTLQLEAVYNGNLDTEQIAASDFPG